MRRTRAILPISTPLSVLLFLALVVGAARVQADAGKERVAFLTPSEGQQLEGDIRWEVSVKPGPPIDRVEFAVDGEVLWTELEAPYTFGGNDGALDTSSLAAGPHELSVESIDKHGRTDSQSIAVTVSQQVAAPLPLPPPPDPLPPPPPVVPTITATPSTVTTASTAAFEFTSSTTSVSFQCALDSDAFESCASPQQYSGLGAGVHTFKVRSVADVGKSEAALFSWTIEPGTTTPPSTPAPPYSVTQSVADGARLTGNVRWTATASDAVTTSKVEFYIDDVLRHTESIPPYVFNGDEGNLDTTTLENGSHALTVKATATDGRTAKALSSVTVNNLVTPPAVPKGELDGNGHQYPRTFRINSTEDVAELWKHDWVVAFPWMNVAEYHQRNPEGLANTYVRMDTPPAVGADAGWHETSINVTYQTWSTSLYPGVQEKYSVESWGGGVDTLADGQAANVGYMRPWNATSDTNWGGDPAGTAFGSVAHGWALNADGTADLTARLMTYAAKKNRLYSRGWDGVWSDNVVCANHSKQFCDGLQHLMSSLRSWLPGKSAGGNGAWEWRNSPAYSASSPWGGWLGSDPQGYFKMANTNLVEGFGNYGGADDPAQSVVRDFIEWNRKGLMYPDPRSSERYNAFWDAYVPMSLKRMRWGLTLAIMAGMHYQAPDAGWYDEYWGGDLNRRGYLGAPVGAAIEVEPGVWRRQFEHGVALHNSSDGPRTVNLETRYRRLRGTQDPAVNDGSLTTSVTIPPRDGRILVRG